MEWMRAFVSDMTANGLIKVAVLAMTLDTLLGILRAAKTREFIPGKAVDGMVKKSGMAISVIFLMLADRLVGINAIGFLSPEIRNILPVPRVGLGELFCILYVLYEGLSIVLNWYAIGLPVPKGSKAWLEKALDEMTDKGKSTDCKGRRHYERY